MTRERWLIFTFVPALILLNAFVVLNYTGLSYQPFSWQAYAGAYTYPDGAACLTPSQCSSTFCVDGVCCNTACTEAGARCDLPGREGVCILAAPAPTLSGTGLLLGAALLAGVGTLGLLRRRRNDA